MSVRDLAYFSRALTVLNLFDILVGGLLSQKACQMIVFCFLFALIRFCELIM